MKNNTPQEIWEKMKTFKKVLLTLHRGPDGDSLGTNTAFKYLLEKNLNLKVDLVSGDHLPQFLQSLYIAREVDFSKDIGKIQLKDYDAVICLDSSTPSMLSAKIKNFSLPNDIFTINIDHHFTNTFYAKLNLVDPSASSCGQVIANFIKEFSLPLDKELAKRLLFGIVSDTECFRFQATPSLFQTAVELTSFDFNFEHEIINPLFFNVPLDFKRFEALIINNIKTNTEKNYCYSVVSLKQLESIGIKEQNVQSGSSIIHDISPFDFVFTIVEKENEINVSFRSRHGVDVSIFAKALGGGGHKPAAGTSLYNTTLDAAEKIILETIEKIGIIKTN